MGLFTGYFLELSYCFVMNSDNMHTGIVYHRISKLLLLIIQEIYAPIIEDHNSEHTIIRPIEQRDRSLWWKFCMWQYITGINFMHRNPKLRLLFTHCHQVCDMIINHGTAMKPTVACHINLGIRWYQNICTGHCNYVIVFNKGSSTVMAQNYLYMYCFFRVTRFRKGSTKEYHETYSRNCGWHFLKPHGN